jgi:hypothetical protein
VTWKQAQARLDSSQKTVINQIARMKEADKQKWSEYRKNDYQAGNKKWQALARKNPERKAEIEQAKRQAQLKMVFGKDMLTDKQKIDINKLLNEIVAEGDDFGSYWGY